MCRAVPLTQLVEAYGSALRLGLPGGVVPEPGGWLAALNERLAAARAVEAAQREEQQVRVDWYRYGSAGRVVVKSRVATV